MESGHDLVVIQREFFIRGTVPLIKISLCRVPFELVSGKTNTFSKRTLMVLQRITHCMALVTYTQTHGKIGLENTKVSLLWWNSLNKLNKQWLIFCIKRYQSYHKALKKSFLLTQDPLWYASGTCDIRGQRWNKLSTFNQKGHWNIAYQPANRAIQPTITFILVSKYIEMFVVPCAQ